MQKRKNIKNGSAFKPTRLLLLLPISEELKQNDGREDYSENVRNQNIE
jgi:hypothetical protein